MINDDRTGITGKFAQSIDQNRRRCLVDGDEMKLIDFGNYADEVSGSAGFR